MTINIVPGGVSLPSFDGLPHNAVASTEKAVIFVMKVKGKQFEDTLIRPFMYGFDENFQHRTLEILDSMRHVTASQPRLMDSLTGQINLSDYIIPSINPQISVKTTQLNDCYRFIMIFTEKNTSLIGGNTVFNTSLSGGFKRIYTGFFMDEPFNTRTATEHKYTFNPNAVMVITHKTILKSNVQHTPLGMSVESVDAMSSETVINGEIGKSLSMNLVGGRFDNNLYMTTPENMINSVSTTSDGMLYSSPEGVVDRGLFKISDTLEQPTHHVSKIVKGFMAHQSSVNNKRHNMTRRGEDMFEGIFTDDVSNRQQMSGFFATLPSPRTGELDLDINSRISLETIDRMVNGDLVVNPLIIEKPMYYESADQNESSMVNMYSSLIANVVCPILNATGISSINFEYSVRHTLMGPEDSFQIMGADMSWTISAPLQAQKIRAFQTELAQGIFRTIFEAAGDFSVLVQANTVGMTRVVLSLVGAGQKALVPFEVPTCLGGIISPLLGNMSVVTANSEKTEALISVTQNASMLKDNFNQDDRDFMDYGLKGFSRPDEHIFGSIPEMIID